MFGAAVMNANRYCTITIKAPQSLRRERIHEISSQRLSKLVTVSAPYFTYKITSLKRGLMLLKKIIFLTIS
jgi:hypothetical protein